LHKIIPFRFDFAKYLEKTTADMIKYFMWFALLGILRWGSGDVLSLGERHFFYFLLRPSCILSIPFRTISEREISSFFEHSSSFAIDVLSSLTRNIVCLESGDTGRPIFFCDIGSPPF